MRTIRIVIELFLIELSIKLVRIRKLVAEIQILIVFFKGTSLGSLYFVIVIRIRFGFFHFLNYRFVHSFFLVRKLLFLKEWILTVIIARNDPESVESSFFVFIISFLVDFFLDLSKLLVKFQLMNSRFHQRIYSFLLVRLCFGENCFIKTILN